MIVRNIFTEQKHTNKQNEDNQAEPNVFKNDEIQEKLETIT